MVTLCDLEVSLNIYVNGDKTVILNVAESIKEINAVNLQKISFKEYANVELEFLSLSNSDKLYFDGIDMLPSEICEVDEEGNLFLKPTENGKRYSIFAHSQDYYAMRVGNFEMRIEHNNIVFYQWFSVMPQNINVDEWTIMQSELEDEVRGLSTDIIRKNISLGNQDEEVAPSQELYKFFVIKSHFSNILAAIIDLKDKPNYKVEKEYILEPLYRATFIDNVTVKDYLMKGTGEEEYLVPKRMYNYDLPENKWLKKIIILYEKELLIFIDSTKRYSECVKEEIQGLKKYRDSNTSVIRAKEKVLEELKDYLLTAGTILNISELIKRQEWYKQIGKVNSIEIPHVLIYDVRYASFYRMYRELMQDNVSIKWSDNYSYSWKLSGKMYEIWSYVKLCRFLISDDIGFEAKGWIFDEYKNEHILVPELMAGTKVEFLKNEFLIKLYYDKTLVKSIDGTNGESNPIFSKSRHIRPDIRMDLYKDNTYWSSLIFEVKYRTIKNFWSANDSSSKEQIRAYKNDTSSRYCRGLDSDFAVRKVRPVDRVWVVNPTRSTNGVIDKRDEGIKFVQLIPGADHDEVISELKKEIYTAFDDLFV